MLQNTRRQRRNFFLLDFFSCFPYKLALKKFEGIYLKVLLVFKCFKNEFTTFEVLKRVIISPWGMCGKTLQFY